MAIQPYEAAPDAGFTQTPPAPPTPQPDGKDRSTHVINPYSIVAHERNKEQAAWKRQHKTHKALA